MHHTLVCRARAVALAISLPLIALLAVAASPIAYAQYDVAASASDGAQHIDVSQCYPITHTGGQDCITVDEIYNDTITPSGIESFDIHGTQSVTETDASGNVVYAETGAIQDHLLTNQGALQEEGLMQSFTVTQSSQTCTYTLFIHYANGALQFDRELATCA